MIGEKIKELRESQGLTQMELSIKTNVPQTTISGVEKGTSSPTIVTLHKLCKGLNISVDNLLDECGFDN